MKIEMGESLLYSWLKHEKCCQIVQTNWHAAKNSWNCNNIDIIMQLIKIATEKFASRYQICDQDKYTQFLGQAEIDVIGINLGEKKSKLYMAEVAFHTNGLGYGSGSENIERIIKKCIRSAICSLAYFGNVDSTEIVFASPKIATRDIANVKIIENEIQELFDVLKLPFKCKILFNDEFNQEILHPIIAKSPEIKDTNELFVRAILMLSMFEKQNAKAQNLNSAIVTNSIDNVSSLSNSAFTTESDSIQDSFIVNMAMYKDFLIKNKYSNNTASSYASGLNGIMAEEKITFRDLFSNLDSLIVEYGPTGAKRDLGTTGNSTWFNALKRLCEFRDHILSVI